MYLVLFSDGSLKYRIDVVNSINFYELGIEKVRGEESAEGVLHWLDSEMADILVTNTHLPDMSGFELAKLVRKHCPKIRVVFLADALSYEDVQQAVRLGADEFLMKSDGIEKLQRTLENMTGALNAEMRENEYMRRQTGWDEIIPRLLRLLSICRRENGEDNWRTYLRTKPLLFHDDFCAEALFARALMEEIRWRIRSMDEDLLAFLQKKMMETPMERLASAKGTLEFLDWLQDLLVDRGLIGREPALNSDAIGRACVYIHTHIGEKLTAESLAAYVHLSPRHFIRKFRAEMNESFSDYLLHVRVRAAIQMLENGRDVKSIPNAVGYKDEKTFYGLFKKLTGCSMREYQQKLNFSRQQSPEQASCPD